MEPIYHPLGVVCAWIIATVLVIAVTVVSIMLVEQLWQWLYRAFTVAMPGMWRARFRRKYGSLNGVALLHEIKADKEVWALVSEEFYRGMYQGVCLCFWLGVVPSVATALYFLFRS